MWTKGTLPFALGGMASVMCNDDVISMGGRDIKEYDVKTKVYICIYKQI